MFGQNTLTARLTACGQSPTSIPPIQIKPYTLTLSNCAPHRSYVGITPGRQQSKKLLTIDKPESKIVSNSVFDCHLSPVRPQMAIKNSVSNDFYLRLLIVFQCFGLPPTWCGNGVCKYQPDKLSNVQTSLLLTRLITY